MLLVATDLGVDVVCAAERRRARARRAARRRRRRGRRGRGRGRCASSPGARATASTSTTATIPQEAGLNERAVSFTKGCYVGQETVARLHYRGKPNRHLRGLRFSDAVPTGTPLRARRARGRARRLERRLAALRSDRAGAGAARGGGRATSSSRATRARSSLSCRSPRSRPRRAARCAALNGITEGRESRRLRPSLARRRWSRERAGSLSGYGRQTPLSSMGWRVGARDRDGCRVWGRAGAKPDTRSAGGDRGAARAAIAATPFPRCGSKRRAPPGTRRAAEHARQTAHRRRHLDPAPPTRCRSGRAPGRAAHPRRARAAPRGGRRRSPTTRWRRPTRRRTGCRPRRGSTTTGSPTTRGGCTRCCTSRASSSGSSCATTTATSRSSRPATAGADPAELADALVAPVARARRAPARARGAARRARCARSRRATSPSTCSSTRCTSSRSPARAPRDLRRDRRRVPRRCGAPELSPLTIARLHGRSPAQVEALSDRGAARARPRRRRGPRDHRARRRGCCCAARSRQLPRWLGQARYNGPPRRTAALLVALPHDYATNPSISADGTHVVYEQYRQKLPVALRLGEIAVISRDLRSGRDTLVSRPPPPRPQPAARPALGLQRDGLGRRAQRGLRVLAGQPELRQALRADRRAPGRRRSAGARRASTTRRAARTSRSRPTTRSWPPTGATSPSRPCAAAGTAQVFVCDLHTGSRTLASGGLPRAPRGTVTSIYEPRLSADGRFVAFTAVTSRASGGPGRDGLERRAARPRCAHTSTTVSAGVAGFASDPTVSADGRLRGLHGRRGDAPALPARPAREATAKALTTPDAGAVVDPQLSADGRVLAYTVVRGARSHVEVRRLDSGAVEQVASAKGSVTDPSLSADGSVLAFTSDAPDLAPGKTDRSRGVFARDLRAGTTTLVSAPTKPAPAKPPLPTSTAPDRRCGPVSVGTPGRAADQHRRQRLRARPRGPDADRPARDRRHLALAQPVLAQRDRALGARALPHRPRAHAACSRGG